VGFGIGQVYPHETTSRVFDLAEQFQKFLATQPHATSVSSIEVMTADGTPMPVAGIGQLCDSGYSVMFSSTHCHVQDPQSGRLIGTDRRQGDFMFWTS
ncbi:gag-pol polyprotein, partial [Trifolium pratense]